MYKKKKVSADGDKHEPYFTGVVWIKKINFIAVEAENAKLKMH